VDAEIKKGAIVQQVFSVLLSLCVRRDLCARPLYLSFVYFDFRTLKEKFPTVM
jgi:hypothetical protein